MSIVSFSRQALFSVLLGLLPGLCAIAQPPGPPSETLDLILQVNNGVPASQTNAGVGWQGFGWFVMDADGENDADPYLSYASGSYSVYEPANGAMGQATMQAGARNIYPAASTNLANLTADGLFNLDSDPGVDQLAGTGAWAQATYEVDGTPQEDEFLLATSLIVLEINYAGNNGFGAMRSDQMACGAGVTNLAALQIVFDQDLFVPRLIGWYSKYENGENTIVNVNELATGITVVASRRVNRNQVFQIGCNAATGSDPVALGDGASQSGTAIASATLAIDAWYEE